MESVKILIANNTQGCGKSTLSLALACHICEESSIEPIQTTLFDCCEPFPLFNKRKEELQKGEEFMTNFAPYEIIPLSIQNDLLFKNTLNLIKNRNAAYIFDIPVNCSIPNIFQLIYHANIIVCPLIPSEKGLNETEKFVEFVSDSLRVFQDKEERISKTEIYIVPNIINSSREENNITHFLKILLNKFNNGVNVTPIIPWRDNLFNDLSTIDKIYGINEIFEPALSPIFKSLMNIYKSHYDGK